MAHGNRKVAKVQILSFGEVLWDVFEGDEFLGGAPLNFSLAAQRLGHRVALLTAVGPDVRGLRVREEMHNRGLTTAFVQTANQRPTGTAIVSGNGQGSPSFIIERPAAFDCWHFDESCGARLAEWNPDWIYFGTLAPANRNLEEALLHLLDTFHHARCFYDVNLRAGHWNLPLVERLAARAHVVKLNDSEAELLHSLKYGKRSFCMESFCSQWASTYGIETICITLGSKGCAIFAEGLLRRYPGFMVKVADTVGAGDAFAASLLHGLHQEWPLDQCASLANALGATVASRAGATPEWTLAECRALIEGRDCGNG